jgi:hypothetical protein
VSFLISILCDQSRVQVLQILDANIHI